MSEPSTFNFRLRPLKTQKHIRFLEKNNIRCFGIIYCI